MNVLLFQKNRDYVARGRGKSVNTLIELRAVMAVVAVLGALLFPVLSAARENAN